MTALSPANDSANDDLQEREPLDAIFNPRAVARDEPALTPRAGGASRHPTPRHDGCGAARPQAGGEPPRRSQITFAARKRRVGVTPSSVLLMHSAAMRTARA